MTSHRNSAVPRAERVAPFLLVLLSMTALGSGRDQERNTSAEVTDAPVAVIESPAARALREGRPISLNEATASDLELLPGIGPATARRIVESREREGEFQTVEELTRVRGIGDRTMERLRPFLRFQAAHPRDGPGETEHLVR